MFSFSGLSTGAVVGIVIGVIAFVVVVVVAIGAIVLICVCKKIGKMKYFNITVLIVFLSK